MNELIRKLSEQACSDIIPVDGNTVFLGDKEIEKFASLIVLECLDRVERMHGRSMHEIRNNVGSTFGVQCAKPKILQYIDRLIDLNMITSFIPSKQTRINHERIMNFAPSLDYYRVAGTVTMCYDTNSGLGNSFKVVLISYDKRTDKIMFSGTRNDEIYTTNSIAWLMKKISHAHNINMSDIL